MDTATIAGLPNLSLADSALHAPFAGFGEHEFYPEFVDKAAVLLERLARNHPLPDGNKRAAWVTLRVFVETMVDLAATVRRRSRTRGASHRRRRVGRDDDGRLAARTTQRPELRTPKGSSGRSRPPSPISGTATGTVNIGVARPSIRSRVLLADPFPTRGKASMWAGAHRTRAQFQAPRALYLRPRMSREPRENAGANGHRWRRP